MNAGSVQTPLPTGGIDDRFSIGASSGYRTPHDDGVSPDEWGAYEYARTRRHCIKLGIGDRTEMEVFYGSHAITGKDTFEFLDRFLLSK